MKRHMLALMALLTVSDSASCEVYRWVDNRGGVHFGDTPPANSKAKLVKVLKAPRPPSSAKAAEFKVPSRPENSTCANAKAQIAYLDLRSVPKPVDDPQRRASRELDDRYQKQLAAYQQFSATRQVHLATIQATCASSQAAIAAWPK